MKSNIWLLLIPIIGLILFFGKVGKDNDYLIGRLGVTFIVVMIHSLSIGFSLVYLIFKLIY